MSIKPIFLKGINPYAPTVFDDGLSYMEAVAKLQHKINECVNMINNSDVETVRQEMEELKNYVDNLADNLEIRVNQSISENRTWVLNQVDEIERYVVSELSSAEASIRTWVQTELNKFRLEVNLLFYSPISGELESVDTILHSMYDRLRLNALTAEEYDNLDLSAGTYDNEDLTAYTYDMLGKTILL